MTKSLSQNISSNARHELSYNFDNITFTENDLGKNQFEIIVQDASGNTASCLAVVNVTSAVSPLQTTKQNPKQKQLVQKEQITNKHLPQFQVFPNPASNWLQLNIDLPIENGTILLYNSKGEKVLETFLSKENLSQKIDIQHLASGVYFVQLQSNYGKTTRKLIVH